MATTPTISDPSQQPITSDDPRVQQILALIRSKQQPIAPDPSPPLTAQIPTTPLQTMPLNSGTPQPQQLAPSVIPQMQSDAPPPPMSGPSMQSPMPQIPAPTPPNVTATPPPTQPGPIKSFLQGLVSNLGTAAYAGTQGAMQRLGLPTDYEKQENAQKQALAQQTANSDAARNQAMADFYSGKTSGLQNITVPNNPDVFGTSAGQTMTQDQFSGLLKTMAQNAGKTGVAQIGADAKTSVATTGATSKTTAATIGAKAKIDVANIAAAAKALQTSQKQSSGSGAIPTGTPAELATAIAQGHVPIDRMGYLLARNPGLIQNVMAADPSFDGSKAMAYPATYKDFTSGKTSVAINAGGTVLQHLLTLQSLNTPESRIPGTAAYQAYENQLATIAPELGKFYGNDTIPGIEGYKKTLGAIFNRGAAIQTQAHSMGVKLDSYQQQWNNAAPSKAYQAPLPGISPAAMAARAALDPTYKVPSATPATSTAPTRPAGVPANAQWNAQGNNGRGQWEAP